jgi:hypothetical protein
MNSIQDTQNPIPPVCSKPKWFAEVNDTTVFFPDPTTTVQVLRAQAAVPPDHRVIRDHNSPNDVVLDDAAKLDLREGNVFYTVAVCDCSWTTHCASPAKLAMLVDDRAEIIGTKAQTGGSIRGLFELPDEVELFRDLHGPDDQKIEDAAAVSFEQGPVFYTRKRVGLTIIVNKKRFGAAEGVKPEMTGLEIAALVSTTPRDTKVFHRTAAGRVEISLNTPLKIHDCDEFDVIRKNVQGGFEASRVDRELAILRENGAKVSFQATPLAAVIFHDLPVRPGHVEATTDVLVPIPGGYPGQFLDWACLPHDSPLVGKVPGALQGAISAFGRTWTRISYHPHNGGGGSVWNKNRHGLHTYIDELLAWLDHAK